MKSIMSKLFLMYLKGYIFLFFKYILINFFYRIPLPALPKFELFFYLWSDAISIAVICYVFVFSMGKIYAKKHKYKVDSNQVNQILFNIILKNNCLFSFCFF